MTDNQIENLEAEGIFTDGTIFRSDAGVIRLQKGEISESRGPNGWLPSQLKAIAAAMPKKEKKNEPIDVDATPPADPSGENGDDGGTDPES